MISTAKDILKRYKEIEELYQLSTQKELLSKFDEPGNPKFVLDLQWPSNETIDFAESWGITGKNCISVNKNLAFAMVSTEPPTNIPVKFPYNSFVIDLTTNSIKDLQQIWLTNKVTLNGAPAVLFVCKTFSGKTLVKKTLVHDFNMLDSLEGELDNKPVTTEDEQTFKLAHRLAYNLMFWINVVKPKTYQTKIESAKTKQELKDIKHAPTEWILGNNVKIQPSLMKVIEEQVIVGSGPFITPKKSLKKFWVRGHFCKQACGPGWSLRKLIWREPFVKGLEDSTPIAHIYQALPAKNSTPQSPLTFN